MIIAILDSGIDLSHEVFIHKRITGISIIDGKISTDFNDNDGHGTIISGIIASSKYVDSMVIIKFFSNNHEPTEEDLIFALKYICENINCDIINISAGINELHNKDVLYKVCEKITSKGTVIVSSFLNTGEISYPASFSNVIGVCHSNECISENETIFLENSLVDVFASGKLINGLWLNKKKKNGFGSSIACARVSVKIAKIIVKSEVFDIQYLKEQIKKESNKTIFCNLENCLLNEFTIRSKVILIAPTDEILLLFENIIDNNNSILGVYDIKYSGNVGKNVNLNLRFSKKSINYSIQNINDINWIADFDCLVIGKINYLKDIVKRDFKKNIIDNCKKYKKLYFHLEFDENNSDFTKHLISKNRMGKFHINRLPKICFINLDSYINNLNLFIFFYFLFKNDNKVGIIGHDNVLSLLDNDSMIIEQNINITNETKVGEIAYKINLMLNELYIKDKEILLTSLIFKKPPKITCNIEDINFYFEEVLVSINPQIIILGFSFNDDINDVINTIKRVEGFSGGKIISIVIYPNNSSCELYDRVSCRIFSQKKRKIEKETKIKVLKNSYKNKTKIAKLCLKYFASK